jgi:hypothetical protein
MLYREVIAVFSEIQKKTHRNALFGQNVEFVNVKPGGTYSNQLLTFNSQCLCICTGCKWLYFMCVTAYITVHNVALDNDVYYRNMSALNRSYE